jgi:hypothetical protein
MREISKVYNFKFDENNYECVEIFWEGNICYITMRYNGTGCARPIQILPRNSFPDRDDKNDFVAPKEDRPRDLYHKNVEISRKV